MLGAGGHGKEIGLLVHVRMVHQLDLALGFLNSAFEMESCLAWIQEE